VQPGIPGRHLGVNDGLVIILDVVSDVLIDRKYEGWIMTCVGIVGTGVIGRGWAVTFARAGCRVLMYDAKDGAAKGAIHAIKPNLEVLAAEGNIESVDAVVSRLQPVATLAEVVGDAVYVQESILEEVSAKSAVFREMDALAPPETILASSSSALPPSDFMEDVPGRDRCIVAHPFNPPYLMPLVELVPSRWTTEETVERAKQFQVSIGQEPVVIHKEQRGYVGNRLQAAVINEAMYLVGENIISPDDLDKTLRWALGIRWALVGPFEGMDLNAPGGIEDYISKFGKDYESLGIDLKVAESWRVDAVNLAVATRRKKLKLGDLSARATWRDRMLVRLRQLLVD